MTALAAAMCGAVVGLGLLLVALGVRGTPPREPRPTRATPAWVGDRILLRVTLGAVGLVVVWLVTAWPAGAAIAAVGGVLAPSLVGARARRNQAVAKIEAIAAWAEQLRDVMAAAAGIQEAIVATGPLAPAAIGPEVRRLVERISTRRERLRPALERFADELAHPLGDMVVTSLLLASERQGRLGELLSEVARSARQTATMRLRVEAARARTYVTTRLIVGTTVVISVWLVVFRREYLAPFDTAAGQVMLVVIGAVFVGAGSLMRRMADPNEPARLLGAEAAS
ncbi:MAG TPA: type II secretion system F family protein [Acidimicrobiales bacterium]|nr:type II secretion system F family protein [Acidimicrobiales bacterium]